MTNTLTSHGSSAASSAAPSRQPSFGDPHSCSELGSLGTSSFPGNSGRETGLSRSPSSSVGSSDPALTAPADAESDEQVSTSGLPSTTPSRQPYEWGGLRRSATVFGLSSPAGSGSGLTSEKYGSLASLAGLHSPQSSRRIPTNGLRASTLPKQKVSDADQGTAPGSSSTLPSSDSCSQAPCRLMEPWNARTTTAWSPSTVYTRDGDDQEDHDQVLLTTDPINMAQTVPSVRSPVNADGDSRCTRASPAESACVSDAISKSTELPLHREAHVSGVIAHSPAKPGRLYMRPLERRSEQQ